MQTIKTNLIYFSATYTTQKIVRQIGKQLNQEVKEYDITQNSPQQEIAFQENELAVFGMPVYSSRIPGKSAEDLKQFKGNNTPAILACVYGNRDYDDALLELKDLVEANGFKVISAGAFIAQHSIFPTVGTNRPDNSDLEEINKFTTTSKELLAEITDITALAELKVKGNKPYKVPGKVTMFPEGDENCTECGTCVVLCPVQAIPADEPTKTNAEVCIACGRCIVVCPDNARRFAGPVYPVASEKFTMAYSARKEPEYLFATIQH